MDLTSSQPPSRRSVALLFAAFAGMFLFSAFQTMVDYNTQIRNKPIVSVTDKGAKGDGITDDTAAFQRAFDTLRNVVIPCGVYKISNVDLKRNVKTNQLNGAAGEAEACVMINGISTSDAVFRYAAGGTLYGSVMSGMTISYPAGSGGCFRYGTPGVTNANVINVTIRDVHCTGNYADPATWNTSPDPNYRTATPSPLSTLRSYGVGITAIHLFDSKVEQNTFSGNGVDIYSEGSDLNTFGNNRTQASGKFFAAIDGLTFGNINTLEHNDILVNGSAGGAIYLQGSYYYIIRDNYYENTYPSSQVIQTVQDRNTRFFSNKANVTPATPTTINTMYQFAPERVDWVMDGNINITNSNLSASQALGQCNATYFANSIGSNETGSYLCVWKDNNIGFPIPDQPGVVKGTVDPYLLSYDNPNTLFGASQALFPWITSGVTGQYVIDPNKGYNWTIPLNQSKLGYQGAGGGFQFTFRIKGRALVNPSNSFIAIDYFNGSTTTRFYQGFVNFGDTAWPETRDITFNLAVASIPPNATIQLASLPGNVEVQSMQLIPVAGTAVLDTGNATGILNVYLANPAPKWRFTLTGDVTGFALGDTLAGTTKAYNAKELQIEACQDSVGNHRMPVNSWGQSLFIGAMPLVTTPLHCTNQTFKWNATAGKFYAVTPATDSGALYPNISNYHWTITRVANGTNGCNVAAGCFVWDGFSSGIISVLATNNTSVGLYTMPAGYVVTGVMWASSTGCSGGSFSAMQAEMGVGGKPAFFSPLATILAAGTRNGSAVYNANSEATDGLVWTIVGTGDTLDHLTTCSADVWARIEQRQ